MLYSSQNEQRMNMKKIMTLLLSAAIVATISSCGSGGGGCETSNPTPINDEPIKPPTEEGFTPAPYPVISEGNSSSSVFIKESEGKVMQIAVPVYNQSTSSTNYQIYTVPEELQATIAAPTTTYASSGTSVVITIPSPTPGTYSAVYVMVASNSTPPTYVANGGAIAGKPYVVILPQINNSQKSSNNAIAVQYNVPNGLTSTTNIVPVYQLSQNQRQNVVDNALLDTNSGYKYPLENCVSNPGVPTAIATTIYKGTYYVGVGTNNGTVCAGNVSADYTSVAWTNLTTYTTRYNPKGRVENLAFPEQSSANILGFWNINTTSATGANTVYRITGQQNSSSTNGFSPTSFWNVTINTRQYSSTTGSSIQFNGAPNNGYSMLADKNLNVFIGTNDGKVYKLANGYTTWSAPVTLTGVTGKVSLSTTTDNNGVIATGSNAQESLVTLLVK